MQPIHTDSPPSFPDLLPLHRLPSLIPSSRPGKRLSLVTIYRWIASGKLRARKVGGARYVSAADLASFLEGTGSGATSAATVEPAAAAGRAGEESDRLLGTRPPMAPARGRADRGGTGDTWSEGDERASFLHATGADPDRRGRCGSATRSPTT